ncbi:hypothetical protein U0070_025892 [Myodes glareolus]|uniref:Uncharacterized protein n=1 Tax=Myodes glareolus TaxID=447135 RepID=A0AAW0HU69_MYOGA
MRCQDAVCMSGLSNSLPDQIPDWGSPGIQGYSWCQAAWTGRCCRRLLSGATDPEFLPSPPLQGLKKISDYMKSSRFIYKPFYVSLAFWNPK